MMRLACLSLLAAAAAAPASAETPLTTYRYFCDPDQTFWVVYAFDVQGNGLQAVVALDGRLWQLEPAPSATGTRYVGGEDGEYTWWVEGEDARLSRVIDGRDVTLMTCVDGY